MIDDPSDPSSGDAVVPPLVTVGLPTYNGERYLGDALASLLAQDYPNFEISISDNASTDRTGEIGRAAAAGDARIRYTRQPANVGAFGNFIHVLGDATGPYFMWASDHDLWAPDFISTCVAALQADQHAVLAYPETILIDAAGTTIGVMDDQIDLDQAAALARYKHLIWRLTICNMIYGVGRREALLATGGVSNVLGADHLILARLALQGPILRVGGRRFYRRRNRPPESSDEYVPRVMVAADPDRGAVRAEAPKADLYRELRDMHLEAVRGSSLPARQKLEAAFATRACFRARFGVPSRTVDLVSRAASFLGVKAWATRRLDRPTSP